MFIGRKQEIRDLNAFWDRDPKTDRARCYTAPQIQNSKTPNSESK